MCCNFTSPENRPQLFASSSNLRAALDAQDLWVIVHQALLRRYETGILGSNVFQKFRGWDQTKMVQPDPMHTVGGELKRIFQMVCGARLTSSSAAHETSIGR